MVWPARGWAAEVIHRIGVDYLGLFMLREIIIRDEVIPRLRKMRHAEPISDPHPAAKSVRQRSAPNAANNSGTALFSLVTPRLKCLFNGRQIIDRSIVPKRARIRVVSKPG